jgi:hypothetical protein
LQAPEEHAVTVALALLQGRLQALQFAALLAISVSQPSSVPEPMSTLQSPKPGLHVGSQIPDAQSAAVVLVVLQARSHAPQCAVVVSRSTHASVHSVFGVSHCVSHTPSTQNSPVAHTTRLAQVVPQVAFSFKLVSQPSSAPAPSSSRQSP